MLMQSRLEIRQAGGVLTFNVVHAGPYEFDDHKDNYAHGTQTERSADQTLSTQSLQRRAEFLRARHR